MAEQILSVMRWTVGSIWLQEIETGFGDLRPDHAAVVLVALLANQLVAFRRGEQPRDVGFGCDHAVADGRAGEALRMRAAQDPQHVVLRGSDAPFAGRALDCTFKAIGCPHQVQQRLFFEA